MLKLRLSNIYMNAPVGSNSGMGDLSTAGRQDYKKENGSVGHRLPCSTRQ
jgi:hypothetical protein